MTSSVLNKRLVELRQARTEIDHEIKLIEEGITKAAYEFSMKSQLVSLNEIRVAAGKKPLTESQFASGCYVED